MLISLCLCDCQPRGLITYNKKKSAQARAEKTGARSKRGRSLRPELALMPLASLTPPQLHSSLFHESSFPFSAERNAHLYTGRHWNSTTLGKQPAAKGLPL